MSDNSGQTTNRPNVRGTIGAMRNISTQDFLNFGKQQVAYVRPFFAEGQKSFMIYAADGTPLTSMESLESAMVVIRHNDLEPVTLQ